MYKVRKFCKGLLAGALLNALLGTQGLHAKDFSRASFELSTSQFIRSSETYFRDDASHTQTSWKLGWKALTQNRGFFAKADLRNDYQAEEDHHYFKPFELSLGWRAGFTQIALGRERQDWAAFEDVWRLGIWQPRFTEDQFAREQAGFTGFSLNTGGHNMHLLFFASPIWIPDISPDFKVKNGKFVSKNPWFKPPTGSVNLEGIPTEVRYDLDMPEMKKLLNHPMAAAQLEFRPTPLHFLRVATAYKPMNRLLLGFPLALHLQDPNYVAINVKTRVVYQHVTTFELGQRDPEGLVYWASLTSERPVRDETPSDWTTQEVKDTVIGSLYLGQDIRGSGQNATHAFVSYLHVDGGDAADKGEFVGDSSLFESRFMFRDAVQIGLRHTMPLFTPKYLTHLRGTATYDFQQHGLMMSTQIKQALNKSWSASFAMDLLGLVDRSGEKGFIANYRANDRVTAGVQYVF